MEISEDDLRAMVRQAIAHHAKPAGPAPLAPAPASSSRAHSSHTVLALVSGGDADGQCLIEPAVRCNHCGYCQSFGH